MSASAMIETKNASLDTMSVTIQALHVGGKQMTLSVFRQLPRTAAYEDDGSAAPLDLWGIVRYEVKYEGNLWLVASSDGCLFRCLIAHRFGTIRECQLDLECSEENLHQYQTWERQIKAYKTVESARNAMRLKLEKECTEDDYSRSRWIEERLDELVPRPDYPDNPRNISSTYRIIGKTDEFKKSVQVANMKLETAKRAEETKSLYLSLPQLFIAV